MKGRSPCFRRTAPYELTRLAARDPTASTDRGPSDAAAIDDLVTSSTRLHNA